METFLSIQRSRLHLETSAEQILIKMLLFLSRIATMNEESLVNHYSSKSCISNRVLYGAYNA